MAEDRLTVFVGRREFKLLTEAWTAYLQTMEGPLEVIDPILTMQRSGRVLQSLGNFLATTTIELEPNMTDSKEATDLELDKTDREN